MRRIGFQSFSLLRSNWNGVGRNRKFSNQQSKSTSTSSSQIKNAKSPDLPTMTMITGLNFGLFLFDCSFFVYVILLF